MSGNKYRATDLVWVLAALVVTLLMAACSGQGENGPVDRIDQVNVANAAAAALGDELERSEAEGVSAKDETAALAPAAAERKASPTRSEEVVDIHGKPVDAGPSRAYGAERLIDDPQMTRVGPAQYWITDRGVGIGGSMTWTYVNGGTVCNYAVWFSGLSGGRYQVLVYIPRRSATSRQALYRVESFVGSQWSVIRDVRVDQYSISDRWVDLGTFDFPAQPAVFLSDATGESYGTRRQVGFDAVKFIDRGSPPPPPAPAPRPAPAPAPPRVAVPMDNYSAGSYAGRGFYRDRVHIGEDAVGPEGGAVRAVADGQIVHYGAASGYGELVVVIEHNLGSPRRMTLTVGHAKTVETRYVCTIYGHLRKSARRGGPALSWRVGQNVRRGDVIGYINDDAHNGDGREHLHMGCRLSARTSGWGYYGYEGRSYPLSNVRYFGAYSEVARLLGW